MAHLVAKSAGGTPARTGTLAWARATEGRLRSRDRLRLLGQGMARQLPQIAAGLAGRAGLRPRRRAALDLDRIAVPDSPAARQAEEICEDLRPEMLVNHSYRTYLWASILGRFEGISFDPELLYVSSLLHDVGLSDHIRTAERASCFTLVGADAAKSVGDRAGWPVERADTAAEAITLHMNLRVTADDGAEAYLMTAGTQLDVIGARYWRIAPATRDAVLARHPRDGVKRGMRELFRAEAGRAGTRSRLYYRYLGLPLLIRLAPFEH